MENNFNNRDFEQFVKQSADQYRMYPSDRVWSGIHNTLHTRRRWYGIGLALLLLTTVTVTWVMLVNPSRKQQQLSDIPALVEANNRKLAEERNQLPPKPVVIAPSTASLPKTKYVAVPDNQERNLFLANSTDQLDEFRSSEPLFIAALSTDTDVEPIAAVMPIQPEQVITSRTAPSAAKKEIIRKNKPSNETRLAENQLRENNLLALLQSNVEKLKEAALAAETTAKDKEAAAPAASLESFESPYTIESVLNSYRNPRKRKKMSMELYVSPTISYRKLGQNQDFFNAARSSGAPVTTVSASDVNKEVTHKPDLGFQVGFTAGYPVSKRVSLTGGLQLNVSKYDIRAFSAHTEMTTIALNAQTSRANSTLTTYSNYRNYGSSSPDWLHNLYISASLPLGAEMKLTRPKSKTYIGIGGTVQPTYILSNRSYLISTDYKNYVELPSLTRKWNLGTGFEIFAGSTTGNLKWRVGPQVRYQVLSSFKQKYPIKERLFDFGLKLGIMLNK